MAYFETVVENGNKLIGISLFMAHRYILVITMVVSVSHQQCTFYYSLNWVAFWAFWKKWRKVCFGSVFQFFICLIEFKIVISLFLSSFKGLFLMWSNGIAILKQVYHVTFMYKNNLIASKNKRQLTNWANSFNI